MNNIKNRLKEEVICLLTVSAETAESIQLNRALLLLTPRLLIDSRLKCEVNGTEK